MIGHAHNKPWTGTDLVFLRAHFRARGALWCSHQLGRTENAVRMVAARNHLTRPAESLRLPTSPILDTWIRNAYENWTPGSISRCAKSIGRTNGWVSRRAGELGLTTRAHCRQPWTDAEIAIVEANAHRTRDRIATLLRKAGYSRSAAGITWLMRDRGLTEGLIKPRSASAVARSFGVTALTVASWIKKGWLIAAREESARDHDYFVIEDEEIARFSVLHPTRIDPRKVDLPWLMDLVARYGSLALIEGREKSDRIVALDALGKSNAEIATILDTSVGSVSVTLSRHRAKVRKQGEAA